MSIEYERRIDLAVLLRAIGHYGWDDLIYTHASLRIGKMKFLINNFDLLFEEQTASQLVEVNMKKGFVEGQNRAGYTIHDAIYRARPDVNCIIHTHTPAGIAISSSKHGLMGVSQAAMLAAGSLAKHDYHGVVDNAESSRALIEDLGSNYFMLMRNHGLLTVGNRIAVTFHRMQRLESACQAQVAMDCDHVEVIDEQVIFDQVAKSRECDWERPGTNQLWEAVTRKMKRLYPELTT